MAERADRDGPASRDTLERLIAILGPRLDELRALGDELTSRWRGDAMRVGERTGAGMHGAFRQLGLVLREEYEELELRVAQLEHRLRLLERAEEATVVTPPRV